VITPLYSDLSLITPPAVEPISLVEMKKQIKVVTSGEDALITTYIAMARQMFEEYTGRQLIDATWEYQIEGFPAGVIELPLPPLLDVLSVTYGDDDTVLVADTDYRVTAPVGPYARRGSIRPLSGGTWPTVTADRGTVRIRYRCGYGAQPGDVPELIRGALYFLAAHFHTHRTEVVPQTRGGTLAVLPIGAESIMRQFKYYALPSKRRLVTA
jgi:uncharacterized phiE125 gp8 family phage protein